MERLTDEQIKQLRDDSVAETQRIEQVKQREQGYLLLAEQYMFAEMLAEALPIIVANNKDWIMSLLAEDSEKT